ncbi:hypothetical protein N0V82_004025 [Gnomoniopsis sp. IMI 355080]|nr:hypothetical protein N0V82_004025 [Gnomoniopsis sp. IMI 355080]
MSGALVEALHSFGFAKVSGYGMTRQEVDEALGWVKKLFDLPTNEKMKAPHPPTPMPHRGYSGIGKEKVYSQDDVAAHTNGETDTGRELRKVTDFKESYEIGSKHDDVQPNIWLPEDSLPGFKQFGESLYERLAGVGRVLIDAISLGLGFDEHEKKALADMMLDNGCQLRLLHYPAVSKEKLQKEVFARLPAHNDWGTFTLLFQDDRGGLELRDAESGDYLHAEPAEHTLVFNVGDMLQRFSNGYFVSPLHRVSLPEQDKVSDAGIPARYSIAFFVGPRMSHTVAALPHFVTQEQPLKYEPVRFDKYGELISKYQYQSENDK